MTANSKDNNNLYKPSSYPFEFKTKDIEKAFGKIKSQPNII